MFRGAILSLPKYRGLKTSYFNHNHFRLNHFFNEIENLQTAHQYSHQQLGHLSESSVLCKLGGTVVHAVVNSGRSNEGDSIETSLPLTVEYRIRNYSSGMIPNNPSRRERHGKDEEILAARIIDRAIRPQFPKGYINEVQITVTVHATDGKHDPIVTAVNATSYALLKSKQPWSKPVGCVRIGYIDKTFIIDPTPTEMETSTLDLLYAGTSDKVLMIEQISNEISEETMQEALLLAQKAVHDKIIEQENNMKSSTSNEIDQITCKQLTHQLTSDQKSWVEFIGYDRCYQIFANASQSDIKLNRIKRSQIEGKLRHELLSELNQSILFKESSRTLKQMALDYLFNAAFRRYLLQHEGTLRMDGRSHSQLREIQTAVNVFPSLHGSSFFQRGDTHVLSTVTLGKKNDAKVDMIYDGIINQEVDNYFMLHYDFPPYATGSMGNATMLNRRMIGHGNLAERALRSVIPTFAEFPYTIRVFCECTSSNGSSSMASACAGSLALLDAGVPIRTPVAAVSVGLITAIESGPSEQIVPNNDAIPTKDETASNESKTQTVLTPRLESSIKQLTHKISNALILTQPIAGDSPFWQRVGAHHHRISRQLPRVERKGDDRTDVSIEDIRNLCELLPRKCVTQMYNIRSLNLSKLQLIVGRWIRQIEKSICMIALHAEDELDHEREDPSPDLIGTSTDSKPSFSLNPLDRIRSNSSIQQRIFEYFLKSQDLPLDNTLPNDHKKALEDFFIQIILQVEIKLFQHLQISALNALSLHTNQEPPTHGSYVDILSHYSINKNHSVDSMTFLKSPLDDLDVIPNLTTPSTAAALKDSTSIAVTPGPESTATGLPFVLLKDIVGTEDYFGDMDLKVAGTKDGITAIQLDVKLPGGLSLDIVQQAMVLAKEGRLEILSKMNKLIDKMVVKKKEHSPHAALVSIDEDRRSSVIGDRGEMVDFLQKEYNCEVELGKEGNNTVYIYGHDPVGVTNAKKMVEDLGIIIKEGSVIEAEIVKIRDFGVVVALNLGQQAILHMSEISHDQEIMKKSLRELFIIGQKIQVQVQSVDKTLGLIRVSRKACFDPNAVDPIGAMTVVNAPSKPVVESVALEQSGLLPPRKYDPEYFKHHVVNKEKIDEKSKGASFLNNDNPTTRRRNYNNQNPKDDRMERKDWKSLIKEKPTRPKPVAKPKPIENPSASKPGS